MLGDLNAQPDSKTMKLFGESWSIVPKTGVAFSFPANKPTIEIDYIMYRGCRATKASSWIKDEGFASDHRPLFGVIFISVEIGEFDKAHLD